MGMMFPTECHAIRGAAIAVHSELGSGFAEEVYQEALELELSDRHVPFEVHPRIRIRYRGRLLEKVYIPDLVCHGKIIVELKAVKTLLPEHEAQVINYLRATGMPLGLLVNFGTYPRAEFKTAVNRPDFRAPQTLSAATGGAVETGETVQCRRSRIQ